MFPLLFHFAFAGDRALGRKKALEYSIVFMALPTFLLGRAFYLCAVSHKKSDLLGFRLPTFV